MLSPVSWGMSVSGITPLKRPRFSGQVIIGPGSWLSHNRLFRIHRRWPPNPRRGERHQASQWNIDVYLPRTFFTARTIQETSEYRARLHSFLSEWGLDQPFPTRREAVQALQAAWELSGGMDIPYGNK